MWELEGAGALQKSSLMDHECATNTWDTAYSSNYKPFPEDVDQVAAATPYTGSVNWGSTPGTTYYLGAPHTYETSVAPYPKKFVPKLTLQREQMKQKAGVTERERVQASLGNLKQGQPNLSPQFHPSQAPSQAGDPRAAARDEAQAIRAEMSLAVQGHAQGQPHAHDHSHEHEHEHKQAGGYVEHAHAHAHAHAQPPPRQARPRGHSSRARAHTRKQAWGVQAQASTQLVLPARRVGGGFTSTLSSRRQQGPGDSQRWARSARQSSRGAQAHEGTRSAQGSRRSKLTPMHRHMMNKYNRLQQRVAWEKEQQRQMQMYYGGGGYQEY